LRKHNRPVGLKAALKASAGGGHLARAHRAGTRAK
jgi:hypothetical protein